MMTTLQWSLLLTCYKFFSYDVERATQLMLTVHYEGKAICGVFTAEVAETKVAMVNQYARENEHPLLCTLEKPEYRHENWGRCLCSIKNWNSV